MLSTIRTYLAGRGDQLVRGLLRNSGWAAAGQLVAAIAMLAETALVARSFPLATFGLFTLLVAGVDFVYGLLDVRTGQAVIRFVPELEARREHDVVSALLRAMLGVDLLIALVGMGGLILFGPAIASLSGIDAPYADLLLLLGAGGLLRAIVRSAGSYLRVAGEFATSIRVSIVVAVTRVIAVAVAALSIGTLEALCLAVVATDALLFLLMGGAAFLASRRRGHHPFFASLRPLRSRRRELATFLFGTNVESTVRLFASKLDVLVIGSIGGAATVAIYKIAARIAGTVLLLSDPLLTAIYPEMSMLRARGEVARLGRLLRGMTLALASVATLGFLLFLLVGRRVLEEVAGGEYLAAWPVALVMLVGTSLAMVFFWARPLLLAASRTQRLIGIIVAAAATQFLLLATLTGPLGPLGAGIGYAGFFAVAALAALFFARQELVDPQGVVDASLIHTADR